MGGVLCFVEDDKGIGKGSATHVCEWGNFDNIFFEEVGCFFDAEDVVHSVVEGAEVWENFFSQIAWEESEGFTGFDSWASENDFIDLFVEEGLNGRCHGEVGFSGTSWADA